MRLKGLVLRVIAVTLLFGGTVRVFATRRLFEAFGIGELWPEQVYAIYIYRVLGAFVIFAGIVLLLLARDPGKHAEVVRGCAVGFFFIGLVMIVTGLALSLPVRHCLPDPAYSFVIAGLLWRIGR
jgi:hypothetical protein